MNRYVYAPSHTVACDLGHTLIIVNYHSGRVHALVGRARTWWSRMARTGDLTTLDAADVKAAQSALSSLTTTGALVHTDTPQGWTQPVRAPEPEPSWGTHEVVFALPPLRPVSINWLFSATWTLVLVLIVLGIGPRAQSMARLIRLLVRSSSGNLPPASSSEVENVVHAVRRAAVLFPFRVACLEESAAAVLALASRGRSVRWCHGVAADPVRLHAWVETFDGHASGEPLPVHHYTRIRAIPPIKE